MLIPRDVLLNLPVCCDANSQRFALGGVLLHRPLPNGEAVPQPLAISCDGHRLLAVTWPEGNPGEYPHNGEQLDITPRPGYSFIMPAVACKKLAKLNDVGKRCPKPILRNVLLEESADPECYDKAIAHTPNSGARWAKVFATNLESGSLATELEIQGRYPRWLDVFPQYNSQNSVSIDVDARYLAEVAKAVAKHNSPSGDCHTVRLTFGVKVERTEDDRWAYGNDERALLVTGRSDCGRDACGVIMPMHTEEKHRERYHWRNGVPTPYWIPQKHDAPAPEPSKPAGLAALPDEFTIDGLQIAMLFDPWAPKGWKATRTPNGFVVEGQSLKDGTTAFEYTDEGKLVQKLSATAPVPPPPEEGNEDEQDEEEEIRQNDWCDEDGEFDVDLFYSDMRAKGILDLPRLFDECPEHCRDYLDEFLFAEGMATNEEIAVARKASWPVTSAD